MRRSAMATAAARTVARSLTRGLRAWSAADGQADATSAPETTADPPRGTAVPARQASTEATSVLRLVAEGSTLPRAVVASARSLIAGPGAGEAVSLGYSLLDAAETEQLGRLVLGLVRRSTSTNEMAWRDLTHVRDADLIGAAGEDWFVPAFEADQPRAARTLQQVLADGGAGWSGTIAVRVARAAFHAQDWESTRAVIDANLAAPAGRVARSRRRELEMLREWLPGGSYRNPVPVLDADVRLGVLNYQQPGSASRNVGDWIQTLASLGHLVRHQDLRFVGTDPQLVSFIEDLAAGVRPERRLSGVSATVQLVEVQRDGMPLQNLPAPTWVPTFGWFMHPVLEHHYLFPFPGQVRPIFISFHVNKPELLTPDAVAYLRRYGPVGCRDWQTVVELHRRGVPAFFSGCLTTTVDTVVPPGDPARRTEVAYVDYPGAPEGQTVEQSITDLRSRPLADNLALARTWVQGYANQMHTVLTSRLHCNLPARSVGCDVVFAPKNRSDVRFGGLIDTDDAAFEAIRHGILDKVASVMELILSGADEDAVYQRWRDVCAPDVAAAERRIAEARWEVAPGPDVPQLHQGVDRVLVVDLAPGEGPHLESFLRALADRVPVGTGVVVSGNETLRSPHSAEELQVACGLPVAFVNHSTVHVNDLGRRVRAHRGLRRQVLLACALHAARGARRVLVLPLASLVRRDLEGLFDLDLQGRALAAPVEPRRSRQLATVVARRASSAQGDDAAGALEFLAAVAAWGAGNPDAVPFDPVVAVLDPVALAERTTDLTIPLMVRYGLTLREALNVLVGEHYVPLPEEWATLAHLQTPGPDSGVLSYAVGTRPWSRLRTVGQQEWTAQQVR